MDARGSSLADVTGLLVGHADDAVALTGCSVVLCEQPSVVGVDVRGAAPATRETDLCRPGTLVDHADAILLSGGSAFGLSAAGGVMRYLYERGIGHKTTVAPVPIVPAACIFDLGIGEVGWPDESMAYHACEQAGTTVNEGCVGAGIGASVGKVRGLEHALKSGIGSASQTIEGVTVGALFVVNALGDVVDPDNAEIVAGTRGDEQGSFADSEALLRSAVVPRSRAVANTTIGVIATNAVLDSARTNRLASIAHDGIARAVRPAHTMYDGDAVFSLATGRASSEIPLIALEAAVIRVVEKAILRAVQTATSLGGIPAARDWRAT